jgi:hypothetical protein
MKKIVLIVLFGVMCSYSHAQIAWGVRAGLCYSTAKDESGQLSGKPSLEAGPMAYYSLTKNLYLNSGLIFSIKNFEQNSRYNDYYDTSLTGYFIDVPIALGYAFHFGKFALYAQTGPYVGAKVAEVFTHKGRKIEETNLLKNFNYGLGAAAGINIYQFKLELGTQYGLANVSDTGDKLTISSVFANIGYIF